METKVIEWEDASFSLDDEVDVYNVCTVGFIVKNNARVVVVAAEMLTDIGGDTHYRGFTAIPKRSIVKIR